MLVNVFSLFLCRDELTVLKALAGTVEKVCRTVKVVDCISKCVLNSMNSIVSIILQDLSSPHHMFQDDPYLLPLNNLEKVISEDFSRNCIY